MQGRLLKPIEESRGANTATAENVFRDPYDSFMQKHLSYYGYFSGVNDFYRRNYSYDWKQNKKPDSESSSSSSEDEDAGGLPLAYAYQDGRLVPRLREGKDLSSIPAGPAIPPQEEKARWPIGMECIREKIQHLVPNSNRCEPMYCPTGMEPAPMVVNDNDGRIVYQYKPIVGLYFARSIEGAREPSDGCAVPLSGPEDTTLIFESRFESGNLQKVVQVSEFEYQLYLRYDLYTDKHTQWYYFRVSNTRAGPTYRFTIVNFLKSKSLYQMGARPLIYSEKEALALNGWHRTGSDIRYYRNNVKYKVMGGNKDDRYFYSLTFTTQFQHSRDTCYFAHCFPYTYTQLQEHLLKLAKDPEKSKICKQRELCRTLAGNVVYCLTITSHCSNPRENDFKKAVVLTARVHPGESNASWIMQGFIDFLTSDDLDAKLLREAFIFKLIPMLNPDGVIVGNYRCSLAGRDLNRNYKTALRDSYPPVYYTKEMITRLIADNRNIVAYFDLHGHSRKHNVFMYGCENRHDPSLFLKERILIYMMSLTSPDKIHYPSCKFKIQKYKEGTGRIVMWAAGLINSFTLEASMCGTTMVCPPRQFNENDYKEIAVQFCDALLDYCDPDPTKYINAFTECERRVRAQLMVALGRSQSATVPSGLNKPSTSSSSLNDVFDNSLNASDPSNMLSSLMADSLLLEDGGDSSDDDSDSSLSDGPPVNSRFIPKRNDDMKKRKKKKSDMKRKTGRGRAESEPVPAPEPPPPPPPEPKVRKARPVLVSSTAVTNSATKPFVLKVTRDVIPSPQQIVKLRMHDSASSLTRVEYDVPKEPKEAHPSPVRFDSRTGTGFPIFTEERSVERMMKKGAICYLEAVTDELLKKRMFMNRRRGMLRSQLNDETPSALEPTADAALPSSIGESQQSKGARPSTISMPNTSPLDEVKRRVREYVMRHYSRSEASSGSTWNQDNASLEENKIRREATIAVAERPAAPAQPPARAWASFVISSASQSTIGVATAPSTPASSTQQPTTPLPTAYLSWHGRGVTANGTANSNNNVVQRPVTGQPTSRRQLEQPSPPIVIGSGYVSQASNGHSFVNSHTAAVQSSSTPPPTATAAATAKFPASQSSTSTSSALTAQAIYAAVNTMHSQNASSAFPYPPTPHLLVSNRPSNSVMGHYANHQNESLNASFSQYVVDTTASLSPSNVLPHPHHHHHHNHHHSWNSSGRRSSVSSSLPSFERSNAFLGADFQVGSAQQDEMMRNVVESTLIIERMASNNSTINLDLASGDFAASVVLPSDSAYNNADVQPQPNYHQSLRYHPFSANNFKRSSTQKHSTTRASHQSRYGQFHGPAYSDGGSQSPRSVTAAPLPAAPNSFASSVAQATNQSQPPPTKQQLGFAYAIVGASLTPSEKLAQAKSLGNESAGLEQPFPTPPPLHSFYSVNNRRYSNPVFKSSHSNKNTNS